MPVYEYRRRCCGRQFEIRASISEYSREMKPACPSRDSEDNERLITVAASLDGFSGRQKDPGPCGGSGGG